MVQFYPDPEVEPISNQGLNAKLDPTQTKDSDGFYVRAGDGMAITGNRQVKVASAGQPVHCRALMSIHESLYPEGIKASTNLQVAPLGFNHQVLRGKAEGVVAAGDYLGDGATDPQKWKKVANLAAASTPTEALTVAVPVGETAVLSTSAQPTLDVAGTLTIATVLTGGVLPTLIKGIAWVGAADGGNIEVII